MPGLTNSPGAAIDVARKQGNTRPGMEKFGIGQAVRRREDERFLTGAGRYIDDQHFANLTHGAVVRSPHAHARIVSIDTGEAEAAPGVVAVITPDVYFAQGFGPIPAMTAIDGIVEGTLNHPPRHALADATVRYVGEPVVFVVAETKFKALAAAELVTVGYEELPAVVDLAHTLDADSPMIWPEAGSNLAFRFEKGDAAGVEAAFEGAAHRVTLDLVNNRIAPMAIEPRGVVGEYDAESGTLTLNVSGQAVHAQRNQMAAAVFKVEPDSMRVVAGDVGGGFGAKNFVYPENILVMLAAKLTGRPVKWISERSEAFLSEVHARDHVTRAELAVDAEGRFLALSVDTIANMGSCLSTMGPVVPTAASWVSMGGTYVVPNIHMSVRAAYTNTMPVDAYRGAGRPEAAYIMERLVDAAAFDLGIDPVEIRRRNFVRDYPYSMPLGLTIDCGDFSGTFEAAAEAIGLDGFDGRRAASEARGRARGIGLSSYLEVTLGMPSEAMELRFESDDTVTILAGTHSTGQGHETAYAQIVHETLGVPFDRIGFRQGDTAAIAVGGGHGGSRSLKIGGSTLLRSAQSVREKGRAAAVHILDAAADDIEFADGLFAVRGTNRRIGLFELERAVREAGDLPETVAPTLTTVGRFERERHSFPNGCHIAEVDVDPETGDVDLLAYVIADDFGRIVNPLIAAGQARGGAVQGIGQALLEGVVYEPGSGQLFTGSLMDYALPRADTVPDLPVGFNEAAPTDTNPLGVKGAGEAGATGAPAAIVNAVLDALKPHGVRHLDMPLTPEKVWRALLQG